MRSVLARRLRSASRMRALSLPPADLARVQEAALQCLEQGDYAAAKALVDWSLALGDRSPTTLAVNRLCLTALGDSLDTLDESASAVRCSAA